MENPDRIHLRDYVVSAEIGAFQAERGTEQRLRFNLLVELARPVTDADDHVDAILSYDVLSRAIATALSDQRYDLVETLAEKIAAEVLAHPLAARIEVTVEKLDRGPFALGVTLTRSAGRVAASTTDLPVNLLLYRQPAPLPSGALVIMPDAPGLPLPEGGDRRRIALLALDQAAWALAGTLGLEVAGTRTELDHAIETTRAVVWAPSRLAADAPESGTDPVSLCFWLARRLQARRIDIALPENEDLPIPPADLGIPVARAAGC